MLLLFLASCWSALEQQSQVTGPLTLEEARELHAPPAVIVTEVEFDHWERGCPHVICIPIVLFGVVAVPNRHEVTIQHQGQVFWKAEYRNNGNFLNGIERDNWQWKSLKALEAKELDTSWIVEVGTAPDVNGQPGTWTGVPVGSELVSQHYVPALETANAKRQAKLTLEATRLFGTSAQPAIDWMAANGEDEALVKVLKGPLFRGRSSPQAEEALPLVRELLLQPRGLEATTRAMCWAGYHPGLDRGRASEFVIGGTCRLDEGWQEAAKHWRGCAGSAPALADLLTSCDAGAGRAIASIMLGIHPDPADLELATADGSETATWLQKHHSYLFVESE
jgi:hypothetical protein